LIKDIQDDEIGINSLAVIDIKSFKEINDFFGNRIGDQVLKAIVRIINSVIKFVENKVTLYKFSADVYCISNYGLTHKDFENIIIYVLGAIKSEIIKEDEYEIDVNATAGITFSPKNNKLITADLALQAAKKQNKDYIVFYEELDDLREYENNMLWTKKLKNALDKDNIIVYYQPLINNKTKKVDKYECLVRLYDEDENKVVAPFFFLNVSKKANLYTSITKIVIDKSFKEFENLEFEFSINVSYEDIADKNFLIFIENRLKKYKVAQRVVWEILEDESIKDYEVLINFINEVKKMGCKIAIDDFGSGYSNFEHILKMNVDYLKIDASLIKYIVTDKNSFNVVKTVVDFAKSLGIKTIAEYVENEDIFNITRDLKIDFSQGYYFSAPIAKPELKQF
jgi:diguanylate cyclase (GGDEF)-like protein